MTTEHDPLYEALVKLEDAANTVGSLTICWQGAYRQLTDSISSGHGEAEARVRFELETALLADAHTRWAGAAAVLNAAVCDGEEWQAWFMQPRRRCPQCGTAETWSNRWQYPGGCNECWAQGSDPTGEKGFTPDEIRMLGAYIEARAADKAAGRVDGPRAVGGRTAALPAALPGNPFEEVAAQRYGERNVLGTEQL